jgi:hypothetical protein
VHSLLVSQIDFIKIDAEAHELYVLEGAKALFKEAPPPMMLIEYYPKMLTLKAVDPTKLVQAMFDAGYRIYDCQSKVGAAVAPGINTRYRTSKTT